MKKTILLFLSFLLITALFSQNNDSVLFKEIEILKQKLADYEHTYDKILKSTDDIMWHVLFDDIAYVEKVRIVGPARWRAKTEDDKFAKNPLQFYSYIFIPKNVNVKKSYPLIVLPHGGIHADFTTYHTHIVKELLAQGYVVVAPEYRGSTGYGKRVYENIDYGGLENEDVLASRDYIIENYSFVDSTRVGIVGWSHGGMIALMNILRYPDKYACAFAGVPVSDLENRLASHDSSYTEYFTAPYHIGESILENPYEYKRRSPSFYAHLLSKPLLIHTNTNDNDVYVEEVLVMIDALKSQNKSFEYKVFQDAEGGHGFDRIDTNQAVEIRFSIYKFLETYLKPAKPFKNISDMRKAAYGF